MKFLARTVSNMLSPVLWLPLIFYFLVRLSTPSVDSFVRYAAVIFFFQLAVPLFLLLFFIKKKQITDIDLTKREERYGLLVGAIISSLCALLVIYAWGNMLLLKWEMLFFILLCINAAITFVWKISFHMAVTVIGCLILFFVFGYPSVWIWITIPLVAWSRLYLKKHTLPQVVAAFLINGAVVLIYYYLFLF